MRYHNIKKYDIANGPGVRTSLWVTGCKGHCPGCFNTDIKDFNSGKVFDDEAFKMLVEYLNDPYVKGLSILGGEPLDNAMELAPVLSELIKQTPLGKGKDIWLWTGWCVGDSLTKGGFLIPPRDKNEAVTTLLSMCNYVVDGPFLQDRVSHNIRFRGSDNQRIYRIEGETSGDKVSLTYIDETKKFDAGKSKPLTK